MVNSGSEPVGSVMTGAAATLISSVRAPQWATSMLPTQQIEEGDKYCIAAQDLMCQYLDKFSSDTTASIKQQMHTMKDAKTDATTSTGWSLGQSKASIYRKEAKALHSLVQNATDYLLLKELQSSERNNKSYTPDTSLGLVDKDPAHAKDEDTEASGPRSLVSDE